MNDAVVKALPDVAARVLKPVFDAGTPGRQTIRNDFDEKQICREEETINQSGQRLEVFPGGAWLIAQQANELCGPMAHGWKKGLEGCKGNTEIRHTKLVWLFLHMLYDI